MKCFRCNTKRETAGSDNVRDDDTVKNQDGTFALRFIEKSNGDMTGEKPMNHKQPTEKRLGASGKGCFPSVPHENEGMGHGC